MRQRRADQGRGRGGGVRRTSYGALELSIADATVIRQSSQAIDRDASKYKGKAAAVFCSKGAYGVKLVFHRKKETCLGVVLSGQHGMPVRFPRRPARVAQMRSFRFTGVHALHDTSNSRMHVATCPAAARVSSRPRCRAPTQTRCSKHVSR